MKRSLLGFVLCLLSTCLYAQASYTSPPLTWVSETALDDFEIKPRSDNDVSVTIVVNLDPVNHSGAYINNCGIGNIHLDEGESAECGLDNSGKTITIASDNPGYPASGTYQIHQADIP